MEYKRKEIGFLILGLSFPTGALDKEPVLAQKKGQWNIKEKSFRYPSNLVVIIRLDKHFCHPSYPVAISPRIYLLSR
jgi:hypothetical protein